MADPRIKQLKISTGVVKRTGKEVLMYKKEITLEEARLEKVKNDESKDEYDERKQEEVLKESKMMVPDCRRRLVEARKQLDKLLSEAEDLGEECEEVKAARIVMDETKAAAEEKD